MDKYEFLEQTEREVAERMVGAIDFLRAWRDVCKEEVLCNECPVIQYCKSIEVDYLTDKNITELVRSVMAQKRRTDDLRK